MTTATLRRATRLLVLTALLGFDGGVCGLQAQPLFDAGRLVPSLPAPTRIELADLDEDGRPEVVVLDAVNGLVGIHSLGNGGGLPLLTSRRFVDNPRYPALADMTLARPQEGTAPVIVLALGSRGLVSLGVDEKGALLDPVVISRLTCLAGAQGDFDGDGNIDLVTSDTQRLAWHAGDGRGGFAPPLFSRLESTGRVLVPLDINEDGRLDLLTLSLAFRGTVLRVYQGQGNGTFRAGQGIYRPSNALDIGIGDFNGDGRKDVVTSLTTVRRIGVYLVDEEGTLAEPTYSRALPITPAHFQVLDLDSDGNLDLLVGGVSSEGIAILRGRGDGTFRLVTTPIAAVGDVHARAVDVDGDGRLDIIFNQQGSGALAVLEQTGRRRLRSAPELDPGNHASEILLADLNGDRRPDLISLSGPSLAVRLNRDGERLSPPRVTEIAFSDPPMRAADFDGDGNTDLVLLASGLSPKIQLHRGMGDGTFGEPSSLFGSRGPTGLEIADFDRNGIPDLLVDAETSGISVLLGRADLTFVEREVTTRRAAGPLATGDFDGDGRIDIAFNDIGKDNDGLPVPVAVVLLQERGGGFRRVESELEDFEPDVLATGDFNSDGILDLASGQRFPSARIRIQIGDGRGGFAREVIPRVPNGGSPVALLTGDIDGDGTDDLVVARTGDVLVVFGSRENLGVRVEGFVAGSDLVDLAAGDLDGDGAIDLLAAHLGIRGTVSLLQNLRLRTRGED
jgi:hypothetical protein